MKHLARKRFGQNFLIDLSVVDNIIRAVDPERGQTLIEIGPGLSALTAPLIQRAGHLTAIEIDRDLVKRLQQRFTSEQLTVVEADVLTVDFKRFGHPLRLVGNLPYNISSPLLFHLVDFAEQVQDQHFMLQKEVVDRMVAAPGDPSYGRLSVMLQARYKMYKVLDVPPDAFDPAPRVDSAVVRMIPLGQDRPIAKSPDIFAKIVQQAFAQRRKMLRRCLSEYADRLDWQALNIPETARAETLSVADFIRLADALVD